jgi:hypothetical protein
VKGVNKMERNNVVFILNYYLKVLKDTKSDLEDFLRYFVEVADDVHGDLYQLSPMQQYKIGFNSAHSDIVTLFKDTYNHYRQNLGKFEKVLEDNAISGAVWTRIVGDCLETNARFRNILDNLEEEA